MMHARISVSERQLEEFCQRWRIAGLELFGSVLRDDFSPGSDIDLLVSPAPEAEWSLLDHIRMEKELAALLGQPVDLVTRRAVERSGNRVRRNAILESARPLYG